MATFKLGKLPYQEDSRTLLLKKILLPEKLPAIPETFDVQEESGVQDDFCFANDRYGDCAIAARAHQTLILEKFEQGIQIDITDQEVIDQYLKESGGDDVGVVLLSSLKEWRNTGWTVGDKTYRIHAFALVDWLDHEEVRQAVYLLDGVQVGLQLPDYAAQATMFFGRTFWDIEDENTDIIGGHGVFAKGMEPFDTAVAGITNIGPVVKSWGLDIQMTWRFWDRYVDECWAVVDEIDLWLGIDSPLDINRMNSYLEEITGSGPFPPGPPEVTVEVKITGEGVVSINTGGTVGGINCFDGDSIQVRIGKTIILTAIPNEGYQFVGWSNEVAGTSAADYNPEPEISVWVTENKTICATFEPTTPPPPDKYVLQIAVIGPGSVKVSDGDNKNIDFIIRGKSPAPIVYPTGVTVELLAQSDDGARFAGFSGDISPMDAVAYRSVNMDQDRTITATFERIPSDDIAFLVRILRWFRRIIDKIF